jgi:hydrogenase expression/formation protein HypE
VAAPQAAALLADWRSLPQGQAAAIVGTVEADSHWVLLQTELGGERVLEELEDDPLPRIC